MPSELGAWRVCNIANFQWVTYIMWRRFLYRQTRKKLCTFFKKILCRYYFQIIPLLTIIIGLLGSTQRAAQNPSVIVAKEGIITTKHCQTLAHAAFNFQINDHRELLQSFPSVTKKKAKCFCLFLVCHHNRSTESSRSDAVCIYEMCPRNKRNGAKFAHHTHRSELQVLYKWPANSIDGWRTS